MPQGDGGGGAGTEGAGDASGSMDEEEGEKIVADTPEEALGMLQGTFDTSDASKWYYLEERGGQCRVAGPVDEEQLESAWKFVRIHGLTRVWRPGMLEWQYICDTPLLAEALARDDDSQNEEEGEKREARDSSSEPAPDDTDDDITGSDMGSDAEQDDEGREKKRKRQNCDSDMGSDAEHEEEGRSDMGSDAEQDDEGREKKRKRQNRCGGGRRGERGRVVPIDD
ncbi:hypothetical protein T484DRAFT_1808824 [Baffinella frigidus]|nr:hypothetical protein T484DRAFT_1808824 [Cryptophyta sp. CCMP2293]